MKKLRELLFREQETAPDLSPEENVSRAVTHMVEGARGAVLTLSGVVGGAEGPSGIYEELAQRLQSEGVAAMRLKYRTLSRIDACVLDTLAAIDALRKQKVTRVVIIGWSFGGAVAINAGVMSERVVGVATIAGQRHRADPIAQLAPKSLLLIHGTNDEIISVRFAHELYGMAGEPKELVLYEKDDHFMSRHAGEMLEKLCQWSIQLCQQ